MPMVSPVLARVAALKLVVSFANEKGVQLQALLVQRVYSSRVSAAFLLSRGSRITFTKPLSYQPLLEGTRYCCN